MCSDVHRSKSHEDFSQIETDHSPLQDVLGNVGRLWRVPLDGMRVWLVP